MGVFDRIRSEIVYARGILRTVNRVTPIAKARDRTLSDVLPELVEKHSNSVAILDDKITLTYEQLLNRSNQYARWAHDAGIRKGDSVALMMGNCPEYLAVWLGIIQAGGVVALLNTNLTGHSLAHCMSIVPANQVIFHHSFLPAFASASNHLPTPPKLWVAGLASETGASLPEGADDLDLAVGTQSADRLPAEKRPSLMIEDPALYIYTSGTTGLPKAAVINHYRVQAIMNGFTAICSGQASDRIYIAQPMYHTAGGILAVGITLMAGGSAFVRDRFSASEFWDDIVKYDCTAFQYIGELCRYLLNAPETPNETRHAIRFCNGNGLRPDIWMNFKDRFQIPRIIEWYAATEGNVTCSIWMATRIYRSHPQMA